MLTEYIQAAMRRATCKLLPEDGTYFCEIPEAPGVWANAATPEEARKELQEVLEDWIAVSLARRQPLPAIEGLAINPEYTLPNAGTPE